LTEPQRKLRLQGTDADPTIAASNLSEPPLQLADDSRADSTDQLSPDTSTPGSGSSLAGATAGADAIGTGGFETLFGKIVVDKGLATAEEIELCNALLRERGEADQPRTLADIMIDNEYLTKRQIDRLRNEFEAKKSSQQIPGYRIKRKVGSGAMATVFLAQQISLDRPVAIKVLPKKFSTNQNFIERFYREGRAAAKLNHPNIVGAYDVGQAGGHHYFVMEFVDGKTVYDSIVKKKRFEEHEAIEIIRQVALALQHAHQRGFVHRDIKPKNIMINSQGVVKLADLGLARAVSDKEAAEAEAGRAYGTPYYISPEQIRGEVTIGPQADIYGLGATFYHMVTGRVPFDGRNPSEVMHRHLKSQFVPPDHVNTRLSNGCAEVIEMMMSKKPQDRYRNVDDLLEDLNRLREGQAPLFAHRGVGIAALQSTADSAAARPDQPVLVQPPPRVAPTDSAWMWLLIVGIAVSLVANLVMLTMLLSK
jgi:serine/threonine-protein kinase